MSRGRPSLGPELADKADGSAQAKVRLKLILQTIAGQLSVVDACQQLSMSEARFHELRQHWIQDACAALEPKPLGRPKEMTFEEEVELLRLHRENQKLKMHLHAAQIREELAIAIPHVLQPKVPSEDTDESKKKS
jgi:hypothetical protein